MLGRGKPKIEHAMVACPRCGKAIPDNARLCRHCGVNLDTLAGVSNMQDWRNRLVEERTATAPMLDELERLAALHERGALTDAEFEQAKAKLLGD